jgi:hypothetical protein
MKLGRLPKDPRGRLRHFHPSAKIAANFGGNPPGMHVLADRGAAAVLFR